MKPKLFVIVNYTTLFVVWMLFFFGNQTWLTTVDLEELVIVFVHTHNKIPEFLFHLMATYVVITILVFWTVATVNI